MNNTIKTCNQCHFPLDPKDVNEDVYELHCACSCEEDDLLVELYNADQAKKTPEEIEQEKKDWDAAADYIRKKGISPNLDSIY